MSAPCAFAGCSTLALLALPQCEYCKRRYCTRHMLPEVHGCDDACKAASLLQASADAIAQRKARRHLGCEDVKQRLDKKLAANEQARRKRPPKNASK